MAGRRTTSIDDRIENQQNKVIRAKAAYEAEVEKLEKLFEKRDAIRKEKFLEAYMKTSRSDAEIMLSVTLDGAASVRLNEAV